MFSTSRRLEFGSINCTSIYENSESNVFENIKFSGETSNNWAKHLLGANIYKILNFVDNYS